MPSIRPSRSNSRRRTASVTAGERKKEAMNLALPSGSSPPEKPPGSMTICASSMALTRASQLAVTSAGVRLRMTRVWGSAPAARNARAVSYSQLVPGNTGMMTLGFATPILGAAGGSILPETASTVGPALR